MCRINEAFLVAVPTVYWTFGERLAQWSNLNITYCLCELVIFGLLRFVNLTVITYNAVGQLWCTVCNCPVKTNLLWNSHIQGRTHREVPLAVIALFITCSAIR